MSSSFSDPAAALALRPFDPAGATPSQWQALHAFRGLRGAEDFPGEPVMADEDFEHELRMHRPMHENLRLLALRDGEIAGILILNFRREGSAGSEDFAAHVDVAGGVARAHRRQGIGRFLLAGLADFMAQRGKTMASTKVHVDDGHRCMQRIGAACNLRAVENRLPFDRLDWDELARWAAHPGLAAAGLSWEVHAGRVPMDTLAPLMAPFSVLINEQPLGALDMPRIRYELQGYETWYADMDRRGGDHFMVMLRDGDQVAAMSDASWDQRFPDRLYQQFTGVARPWRGKGLGKAVKARLLELVRARHPQVRTVLTRNAQANAAMLSINDRLGFAVYKEEGTYQFSLDTLRAWLR